MVIITELVGVVAFFCCILVLLSFLLIPKPLPGIPYTWTSAYLGWGDLPSLAIHNFLTGEVFDWFDIHCRKQKSPIVQLFMPNYSTKRPFVVVSDLREIEDIVTRRNDIVDRAPLMHELLSLCFPHATTGMGTTADFKQKRGLLSSILTPKFMNEVSGPCVYEAVQDLIELWKQKKFSAGELPFDVHEDLSQIGLDATWKIMLGEKLGVIRSQIEMLKSRQCKVKHASDRVSFSTRHPPLYGAFQTLLLGLDWVLLGVHPATYTWIIKRLPPFKKAQRMIKGHVRTAIDAASLQARNSTTASSCGIEEVILRMLDKQIPLTKDALLWLEDDCLELLVAGHETSATAAWTLKYLSDNQGIQTTLRDTLHTAFGDIPEKMVLPTAAQILTADLPYFDAIIAEVLRVARPGPVSFRQTTQDTSILGHPVPAHTNVVLNPYNRAQSFEVDESCRSITSQKSGLHYPSWDTRHDLNEFKPERWLERGIDGSTFVFNSKAGPALPFSAGPRGCFGKKIALMELRILVVLLVLQFDFGKVEGRLAGYDAKDALTRCPSRCYVKLSETSWAHLARGGSCLPTMP